MLDQEAAVEISTDGSARGLGEEEEQDSPAIGVLSAPRRARPAPAGRGGV